MTEGKAPAPADETAIAVPGAAGVGAPVLERAGGPAHPVRPRRRAFVAVGIAALLLVAGTVVYVYAPTDTDCAISKRVGEYNVTSPQIIVNLPLGGGASGTELAQNWTFASGSVVLGNESHSTTGFGLAAGGGTGGLLLQTIQPIFAVYAVHNVSAPSSAGNHPCTQPFVAGTVNGGYCGSIALGGLSLPNPANDSVEPQVFNSSCPYIPSGAGILPGAYMSIDNEFPADPVPSSVVTMNLCAWTSNFTQAVRGAVAVPVVLHAPYDGRFVTVHGYLWWLSVLASEPTAGYVLAHGAIWRVASVGLYSEDTQGLLPPGLLAFERLACP